MNQTFKSFGIVAILCFSFYYTHQFALLMRQKDPIYQTILMKQEEKKLESVNAIIDGEYIIPGLSEKTVNVDKSFQKMKNAGAFLEPYLVFDETLPDISTSKNKDKVIRQGNSEKRGIAIILEQNSNLEAYFETHDMDYSILITQDQVQKEIKGEKINVDSNHYVEVEKLLSKQEENKNLCFVPIHQKEFCKKKKKILIEPTIEITNHTFASFLSKIKSGDIVYLRNLDSVYLDLLVETIIYKGYSFYSVSDLIRETR